MLKILAIGAIAVCTAACHHDLVANSASAANVGLETPGEVSLASYDAFGFEPSWSVNINFGTMTFKYPGATNLVQRTMTITSQTDLGGGDRIIEASNSDGGVTFIIEQALCYEDGSGDNYRDKVVVVSNFPDASLVLSNGCGGPVQ